ncbi:uncharacterized protein K441DRAFT_151348 [Cenococcum geophilum 1.58]|uniref:uncharacterized protein n=1 Tax=Cenococcum geophilum 1.58 TaxID=794803 RepID=UPI00358EB979|nr:hypothetical protein K441DRAFT_151348 [Cenococcum geophilum 1.58]
MEDSRFVCPRPPKKMPLLGLGWLVRCCPDPARLKSFYTLSSIPGVVIASHKHRAAIAGKGWVLSWPVRRRLGRGLLLLLSRSNNMAFSPVEESLSFISIRIQKSEFNTIQGRKPGCEKLL